MKHTLIGMYDSPFVRRVAITMQIYALPFEHRTWSVFGDFDKVLQHNPLGRVPVLLIDGDEALIESNAILDYLDELAGPEQALMPARGVARRVAIKRTMVAMGVCEKAVALYYETARREQQYQDPNWITRLEQQLHSALDWMEADMGRQNGETIDQPAITAAVMVRFVLEYLPAINAARDDPALDGLSQRLEATPAFQAVPFG